MEAAPGILRRGYEKRRRRDVARQAPSLRTEWIGWPHSAFLQWTSHDHEWHPSRPPSTAGRNVQPLAARKESPEAVTCTQRPNTPPTAHHATRLLWLSREILRSLRHLSGAYIRLRTGF